jgi:hypothetical protein
MMSSEVCEISGVWWSVSSTPLFLIKLSRWGICSRSEGTSVEPLRAGSRWKCVLSKMMVTTCLIFPFGEFNSQPAAGPGNGMGAGRGFAWAAGASSPPVSGANDKTNAIAMASPCLRQPDSCFRTRMGGFSAILKCSLTIVFLLSRRTVGGGEFVIHPESLWVTRPTMFCEKSMTRVSSLILRGTCTLSASAEVLQVTRGPRPENAAGPAGSSSYPSSRRAGLGSRSPRCLGGRVTRWQLGEGRPPRNISS